MSKHPHYRQFRARLFLGFSLLLALLLLLLSWHIYTGYQSDRGQAADETKIIAQAMSAHVLSIIETADLSLKASAAALATLDPNAIPSTADVRKLLSPAERTPDANFWVIFVGRDGKGIAASNGLDVRGVSLAERPYFADLAKARYDGLYVGGPEIGLVSHRRLFVLSRRVVSASGIFLGVVAAPMDAAVVGGVFANSLFQHSLSIALLHSNGKIIARAPNFEVSFGKTINETNLSERVRATPAGTFEATSLVDGTERIFSYKAVDGLPLLVFVGIASESWTRGIKEDVIAAVVGLGVILGVMAFSGVFVVRSYRRLEQSESSQRGLIEDLKCAQEKLTQLARFDNLTGLPNRTHLYERLEEAIARARRNGSALCCLYLDIDHFKEINDTLGHGGGDAVLKKFGERLHESVRETDMVARLAGDEFVIVLEGLNQRSEAQATTEKVIEAIRAPFAVEGQTRMVTSSIGAVIASPNIDSPHEDTPDALLKKADAALYAAKRSGRNGFAFYREQ